MYLLALLPHPLICSLHRRKTFFVIDTFFRYSCPPTSFAVFTFLPTNTLNACLRSCFHPHILSVLGGCDKSEILSAIVERVHVDMVDDGSVFPDAQKQSVQKPVETNGNTVSIWVHSNTPSSLQQHVPVLIIYHHHKGMSLGLAVDETDGHHCTVFNGRSL